MELDLIMPRVLTKEQIEQYHDQGFISPIRVISEKEALSIKDELEQVEKEFPHEINSESRNNLHLSFAFLDALAHNTIIVDAIEDLIGPNISLWASVMFIKEPSSKQYVSWHQDATYMGLDSLDFPTPWIALSPSNKETGCMTIRPAFPCCARWTRDADSRSRQTGAAGYLTRPTTRRRAKWALDTGRSATCRCAHGAGFGIRRRG